MIQTIRVQTNVGPDLKGDSVLHDIKTRLKQNSIKKVRTVTVYRLEGITKKQAKVLAEKLLCEEINQTYSLNEPIDFHLGGVVSQHLRGGRMDSSEVDPTIIEIAYKQDVMNPQVASLIKAAKDLGIHLISADSSKEYLFFGKIKKTELLDTVEKLNLYNKTVEHIVKDEPKTLLMKGTVGKTIVIPIRTMTDELLMELSKDKLFLNLEEMKVIQKYFQKIKRDPTDCELETLAQTWSEHCYHKTFKAKLTVDGKAKEPLFTRLKKEALKHDTFIVSAFEDNSGVMEFYDGFSLCGKGETHNAPSAIEPYGGAATGSGGVFRDIVGTGLGAKCIASTDIFCFANPHMNQKLLPSGCLPPDYLLKRVVAGVRDYGNRMGIPTNNGSVHFHNDFRAKPTVLVGSYGIAPTKYAKKGKVKKGDIVVSIGGRTGRDGIHGATFSSGEMTDRTIIVNSSAVQIGNAIEEKRMFDAILEARDKSLIAAIQDCGAGGFSSAIGEMGKDIGVRVHLEKAKLKYEGLTPWEIWISESQERMVIALSKKNVKKFLQICEKYNVEASLLGEFDGGKKLKVYYGKKLICNLDMKFLHEGLPQRKMIATSPKDVYLQGASLVTDLAELTAEASEVAGGLLRGGPTSQKEWIKILKKILSHGNICSKEPIVRLYDHSVQGTNDLQPYSGVQNDGPNDAVVLRPFLDKPYGMVLSHGFNPVLNKLDPYWGSIWAAVEALSNYVAAGGDYKQASLINNYIWPFPDEEHLWSLDTSVDAVVDIMKVFKIPVISGKDSLSSTYRGKDGLVIHIPPVLCISVFGRIKDASKTVTADFKKEGSVIVLVGLMDFNAMGGSVYSDFQGKRDGVKVPKVDLKLLPKIFQSVHNGIKRGKILSAHDISEGGIITSLFEMCVGGDCGAVLNTSEESWLRKLSLPPSEVSLSKVNIRPDYFLFNETAGCFLVELENAKTAKEVFKNVPFRIIGKTQREKEIRVDQKDKKLFSVELDMLKKAWKEPMKRIFA